MFSIDVSATPVTFLRMVLMTFVCH